MPSQRRRTEGKESASWSPCFPSPFFTRLALPQTSAYLLVRACVKGGAYVFEIQDELCGALIDPF